MIPIYLSIFDVIRSTFWKPSNEDGSLVALSHQSMHIFNLCRQIRLKKTAKSNIPKCLKCFGLTKLLYMPSNIDIAVINMENIQIHRIWIRQLFLCPHHPNSHYTVIRYWLCIILYTCTERVHEIWRRAKRHIAQHTEHRHGEFNKNRLDVAVCFFSSFFFISFYSIRSSQFIMDRIDREADGKLFLFCFCFVNIDQ